MSHEQVFWYIYINLYYCVAPPWTKLEANICTNLTITSMPDYAANNNIYRTYAPWSVRIIARKRWPQEHKAKSQDRTNENDTEARCILMRFNDVPTSSGYDYGRSSHKQQLHRHPGTTAATPPPTPAAKSSHGYTVVPSYLWTLGIQSTNQTLSLTYQITTRGEASRKSHRGHLP